jgi:hypothetical protein
MEDTLKFEVAVGGGMSHEICRMPFQRIQANQFMMQGDSTRVETPKPPRQYVAIKDMLTKVAASSDQLLKVTTNPDGLGSPDVASVEDVTAGCDFLVCHLTNH